MRLLGVDTGGTFTDFVYYDGERLRIHKVLSTPSQPQQAILQGLSEMSIDPDGLYLIHGSTVATNALLESKGVRTAYIANTGLTDVLTLARQERDNIYDLAPKPLDPPVPGELCFEVESRTASDGSLLQGVSKQSLVELAAKIEQSGVEAVAVNLLFSFLDPEQEQLIRQALPKSLFIACSADILPQAGEYERGIATWINASLGPLMQRYLQRLQDGLPDSTVLSVMQSSGGTASADEAATMAVHLLLSGPAGGLMAAKSLAQTTRAGQVLTFDMGGTSTDVALIDGDIQLTGEGRIGRFPVSVPMVDMHTIGAGGGSIARLDEGGALQVGPESAGASPGPACYGAGGSLPTVTDANVVLGRLPATAALGGHLALEKAAAESAVQDLAASMGMSMTDAAAGIIRLANEHMAQALRVISVQRGVDVREYSLLSFGGAGGLHVCALAELMGMRRAVVPIHSGVLSALGMLLAPRQRVATQGLNVLLDDIQPGRIEQAFASHESRLRAALIREGVVEQNIQAEYSLDLRYKGQSYCLELPWSNEISGLEQAEAFHRTHQHRYGHAMDLPVELVNIRLKLKGPPAKFELPKRQHLAGAAPSYVEVHGYSKPVPCYQRVALQAEQVLDGPAIIVEAVATTFVDRGWQATVDSWGNILLKCSP